MSTNRPKHSAEFLTWWDANCRSNPHFTGFDTKPSIKACWCIYCGHPVLADGVSIDPDDDTDRDGHGRDRCADTACESAAVATYQGDVLVVAG